MNTDLLNEFLTLASTQAYAEAADKLYISQASLSRHMKQLEAELGIGLFDHASKKVRLTEYGLMLVPYAQEIIKVCNNLLEGYMYHMNSKKQTINIGVANGCDGIIGISELVIAYSELYPETKFNITNDFTTVLLSSINNHTYDFVFVREQMVEFYPTLPRIRFAQDILAAYMSILHPLAYNATISIDGLKGQPLITNQDSKLSSQILQIACKAHGFEPWIVFRGSHEQIAHYLRSGAGIGIQFKGIYSDRHADHDIVISDIVPEISVDINLICDTSNFSENKKRFRDYLLEHRRI